MEKIRILDTNALDKSYYIIPEDLVKFDLNGNSYYIMTYDDEEKNNESSVSLLMENNNKFVNFPINDYKKLNDLLDNVDFTLVDKSVLPAEMELGYNVDIDSFTLDLAKNCGVIIEPTEIEKKSIFAPEKSNIVFTSDMDTDINHYNEINRAEKYNGGGPKSFPAYVIDDDYCFIPKNIYDKYLKDTDLFLIRIGILAENFLTVKINGEDCVKVKKANANLIYELSNYKLIADYIFDYNIDFDEQFQNIYNNDKNYEEKYINKKENGIDEINFDEYNNKKFTK